MLEQRQLLSFPLTLTLVSFPRPDSLRLTLAHRLVLDVVLSLDISDASEDSESSPHRIRKGSVHRSLQHRRFPKTASNLEPAPFGAPKKLCRLDSTPFTQAAKYERCGSYAAIFDFVDFTCRRRLAILLAPVTRYLR